MFLLWKKRFSLFHIYILFLTEIKKIPYVAFKFWLGYAKQKFNVPWPKWGGFFYENNAKSKATKIKKSENLIRYFVGLTCLDLASKKYIPVWFKKARIKSMKIEMYRYLPFLISNNKSLSWVLKSTLTGKCDSKFKHIN